jgi:hypothetical protein
MLSAAPPPWPFGQRMGREIYLLFIKTDPPRIESPRSGFCFAPFPAGLKAETINIPASIQRTIEKPNWPNEAFPVLVLGMPVGGCEPFGGLGSVVAYPELKRELQSIPERVTKMGAWETMASFIKF